MILLLSSRSNVLVKFFEQNNIKYLHVSKEEFKTDAFFNKIRSQQNSFRFALVYNFGYIVPDKWFKLFPFINYHFSLLPKYRGATPIPATILNQDEYTGITCQFMEKELDVGRIICQKKYKRPKDLNAGELFSWLEAKLPLITKELLNMDLNKTKASVQSSNVIFATKKLLSPDNANLFVKTLTAQEIRARVLAFNPEPIATMTVKFKNSETDVKERELKVFNVKVWTNDAIILQPGQVFFKKKVGMIIGTLLGNILITQAAFPGKKHLSTLDWLTMKGKIVEVL